MDEQVPPVVGLLVGLLCAVTGAVTAVVARRAADGRLDRNGVAGIRTRATLRTDEAWRAGHSAARGLTDAAAAVLVVTGAVAATVRSAPWFAGVVLVGLHVGLGVLVAAARRAGRAADAAQG